jgi:hypothetical protein
MRVMSPPSPRGKAPPKETPKGISQKLPPSALPYRMSATAQNPSSSGKLPTDPVRSYARPAPNQLMLASTLSMVWWMKVPERVMGLSER